MNTAVMTQQQGAMLEQVLIGGNLAALKPEERVLYYKQVCESVGLNPITKPFEYITLNGKLTLYALRSCTEQLRQLHGVSIIIVSREVVEDCYVVTARATDAKGRNDESIGAVPIGGLKGEARSNAMMKAETKAKRRVTLSICGLGLLDETEVGSVPGAYPGPITPTAGALERITADEQSVVMETANQMITLWKSDRAADAYALWQDSKFDADQTVALWSLIPDSKMRNGLKRFGEVERAADKGVISPAKHKRLEALIKEFKLDREGLKQWCSLKFSKGHFTELTYEEYKVLDEHIAAIAPSPAAEDDSTAFPDDSQKISDDQLKNLLLTCEQTGVKVERVLLKAKLMKAEDMLASDYNGCLRWIASQAKGAK